MKDQTIAIRVKEICEGEAAAGRSITEREAVRRVLVERGDAFVQAVAVEAVMRISKDPRPPGLPEPTAALFDPSEPIRVPDGENGYLWVGPEAATIGQHLEANDDARQWLRGQLKTRDRAAVDIQQVADFADGDLEANYRRTLRAISGSTDE